jgi:uncharacterized membrane protein HdeD (DUF308 family)
MSLAQIGPITTIFEGLATAVGAGILLGGFVLGLSRFWASRSRRELENNVLLDGYLGGIAGVAAVLLDLFMRYAA